MCKGLCNTMRRNDRIHKLLDALSDGALHRAQDLACHLKIAPRTLYRDIARLRASGIAVEGTRGQGYRLTEAVHLPPISLSPEEVEALQLALAVLLQTPDPALQATATTLAAKIDAALPEAALPDAETFSRILPPFADPARGLSHLPVLRAAIRARQKLRLVVTEANGAVRSHVFHPEGLRHAARVWVLDGWSESAQAALALRIDLIETAEPLPELFG